MKSFFSFSVIVLGVLGLFYLFSRSSSTDKVLPTETLTSSSSPLPSPTVQISPLPIHTIGQVTRHVAGFVNQEVQVQGYMLVGLNKNYVIFSDETGGAIGIFDLPVTGVGVEELIFKQKYILRGKFVYGGLNASNHNQYHLELSALPEAVK